MSERRSEVSPSEISAKGKAIYEKLREKLEAEHWGDVVVIDIFSGDYEVAPDDLTATLRMFERRPDALTWGDRIGDGGVARFSPRMTLEYYQAHGFPHD